MPCSSRHRRRRLAPSGGWASLHEDLVQLIGWQVLAAGELLDFTRFRAVCSGWNTGAVSPRGRGLADLRFHPRRWMMFPEGHGLYPGHPDLGGYVRFINLSSGDLVRIHLPLFHEHLVLDSTDGGLLLLLQKHDAAVRLLHPFTGDVAEFPPFVSAAVAEAPKATQQLHHRVQFARRLPQRRLYRVAYATAGDQQWRLSAWTLPRLSARTMSFQGKLYAAAVVNRGDNNNVYIYQIDLQQSDAANGSQLLSLPKPKMIAKCPLVGAIGSAAHLVECGSELMLVGFADAAHEHLEVYRVADLASGRVVPVTDIGEHAIFLLERGVCVSPNNKGFPSVTSNTIICKHTPTLQEVIFEA
ncbi:hypothetical protein EJB05_09049, partial [Eragrostis curvula]